jgi:hypothetical protein
VAAFLDISGDHGNPQGFLIWNGLRTTLLGPFFCVISLHDRAKDPPLSAAMELLEADLEALRKARANVRGSAKLR